MYVYIGVILRVVVLVSYSIIVVFHIYQRCVKCWYVCIPGYQVFVNLQTSIPPDSSEFLMCLTFCLVLIGLVMVKLFKLRTSQTTFLAQKMQNRRPNGMFRCCRATKALPGTSYIRDFSKNARTATAHHCRSSKKILWPQYDKEQIQRPETTFSNFSDKVAVPRGHENCCRFATL